MNSAQSWFNNLKKHEQLVTLGCVVLVLLYLSYLLLWSPIADTEARLRSQNQQAQQNLDTVRALADEYQQLAKKGVGTTSRRKQNLSKVVDSSVKQNGLVMKRYQPSASGGAQVRFENVAFSGLVAWLHQMESKHAIIIKDLSITKGSASGLVNVSVRLQQTN